MLIKTCNISDIDDDIFIMNNHCFTVFGWGLDFYAVVGPKLMIASIDWDGRSFPRRLHVLLSHIDQVDFMIAIVLERSVLVVFKESRAELYQERSV